MFESQYHRSCRRPVWSERFAFLLAVCLSMVVGCNKSVEIKPVKKNSKQHEATTKDYDPKKNAASVESFCGDCHAVPPADSFDKLGWQEQVESGFTFYVESGRSDLTMPLPIHAIEYFSQKAPETLVMPVTAADDRKPVKGMRPEGIAGEGQITTADVQWLVLPGSKQPVVVYSDLRNGQFGTVNINTKKAALLANLGHPAQFQQADLDQDGHQDFVVGDLGSFKPDDHDLGRVIWLRWNPDINQFETRVLQSKIGRVAGVEPGDFDGDGDLDLVVAEFGWRSTGSVFLLENIMDDHPFSTRSAAEVFDDHASFVKHQVDYRHGSIDVPVVDINGDGKLDFMALFSQEHEEIVVYENQGSFNFNRRLIYSANDPAFGSSGIELSDLDQDGDDDILFSNGDAFDTFLAKPYHGIRWLENHGNLKFTVHELAHLPGAHSAKSVDFDADGDLDIVAVALLPENLKSDQNRGDYDSAILLRNDGKQNFAREQLEVGVPNHPRFLIADLDRDGDPDFVAGNYNDNLQTKRITVWWNEIK